MKITKFILFFLSIVILNSCGKPKFVFKKMRITKAQIDSLQICGNCNSTDDSCVKRLTFQYIDSNTNGGKHYFYLVGWKAFKNKGKIDPIPFELSVTNGNRDTAIEQPFTFANVEWLRRDIIDFLKQLPGKGCDSANYSYIELSTYIDDGDKHDERRYLSLKATAFDSRDSVLISVPLKSNTFPNPRPPYPPGD